MIEYVAIEFVQSREGAEGKYNFGGVMGWWNSKRIK